VNSTTIPASSTLITTASTTSALTSFGTDPTANTQAVDNSSTKIATTAFVLGQASSVAPTMDGTAAVGTSTRYARADHVHGSDTSKASLTTSNTFTTGTQIIATGADATVGLRVKRNSATQSANILEVTQSDGTTVLAKVDSAGAITAPNITDTALSTAGIVTNTSAGLLGTVTSVPIANGGTGVSTGLTVLDGGNITAATVTAGKLTSIAKAPTFWYSPTSDFTTGTLTASTPVDPFGLNNGVTVGNNKTYFVDYVLTGKFTSSTASTLGLRLTIGGNAVANFNFIENHSGLIGTAASGNWLATNNFGAFVNTTTSNSGNGGTTAASSTGTVWQLRFSGILRTASTGSYFQPKISSTTVNGSTFTVLRESYASLMEIGTDTTTSLGTWG
jgi:hypothetical protein